MARRVLDDDADEKWEGYPGHTRAKHKLMRYYLNIWLKKLGNPNRKLRIFDCFAGRGEYYPEDGDTPFGLREIESKANFPGSPQIILDVAVERADKIGEIECVFIEKKEKNAEILRANLPNADELPVEYEIVEGTFQNKTIEWVRNTGGFSGPAFFFIDPFGYKALEYDVVTKLGRQTKFEVFVNLMANEVHQWQDADKHHAPLTNLFGTDNWHVELEKHEPKHWNDKEVSYYCQRLRKNGPEHTRAYLVTEEDTRAMKYYLIFGTNSKHGVVAMENSMQNCGVGEYAYAPERTEMHEEQQGLTAFTEEQRRDKIKRRLIETFSDQSLSFNDMIMEFITENEYSSYQRKHIRKAVKELEQEGEVSVSRITSSTDKGLGGEDIIQFD